jgi:poly [ADP-ribose] polymerase
MLWYGTRLTNYVSLLNDGFKLAPEEAPSSSYSFGKGIYFSDMASKSLGQCFPSNGVGLLLLCEVALGDMFECKTFEPKAKTKSIEDGKNSVKVAGIIEPDVEYIDGVFWPKGKLMSKPGYVKKNNFRVCSVTMNM